MKFSRKVSFMTLLKVTKKQDFTLSPKNIFFEKPKGERVQTDPCRLFRVFDKMFHIVIILFSKDVLVSNFVFQQKMSFVSFCILLPFLMFTDASAIRKLESRFRSYFNCIHGIFITLPFFTPYINYPVI